MDEEIGLAQQAGGRQMGGQQDQMMQMVQEVARMLANGATPEELMQQGVPPEVIQAAMEMLSAQTPAPQVPAEQAGLANTVVSQGGM